MSSSGSGKSRVTVNEGTGAITGNKGEADDAGIENYEVKDNSVKGSDFIMNAEKRKLFISEILLRRKYLAFMSKRRIGKYPNPNTLFTSTETLHCSMAKQIGKAKFAYLMGLSCNFDV